MSVYGGFDQQTLDREYNARATVSEAAFDAALLRYAEDSARMRGTLPCLLDRPYGPSPDEVLDIFPAGDGAPLFVYVHGGYWRMLSHKDSSFMAEAFTASGVAVAAVNYSLVPAVDLDEIVRQCRAAIAWLHANAADFGADPERIFIAGSSAGGHLVGMLIAGGWHEAFGVPEDVIKACCGLSGIYDLQPLRHSMINDWVGLDTATAERNSPIRHLPRAGCPLIVSCGESETAAIGPECHTNTEFTTSLTHAKGE